MEDREKVRRLCREMDLDVLLKRAYETGFRYERDYHGCAQAVVGAIHEVFGIENLSVFMAASGLGGGIGLTCLSVCGGLTGGTLVLGQLYGRTREGIEDKEGKRRVAYGLASRLLERYMETYGSTLCPEIQKQKFGRTFDLRKPEDFKALVDAGGHSHLCPEVVGTAAAMTAEILYTVERDAESC